MTSPAVRSLLLDALRRVPELAVSSQLDASPLREGINRTFLVTVDGWQRFAVRLCEPGMAELVARDAERDCARRMARCGVSVELLSLDTASGALVTRWERGARAIDATAFSFNR